MKKLLISLWLSATVFLCTACGSTPSVQENIKADPPPQSVLVYGSNDYTRINPAMDEHGEINILLFNGLTAHNGKNEVVPCLAKRWEFDENTNTYTFYLQEHVKWHDGEAFTAEDVKFTIDAVRNPENGSENAPNYEDIVQIRVIDDYTVAFQLEAYHAAFLDYMALPILPAHCLAGEDMQESEFFRHPVGTGPYRLKRWEEGQAIVLEKNEDYFLEKAKISQSVFKIVPDDTARAVQMEAGELDLALLAPKDAQSFAGREAYTCYDMKTSDYRGILFNFQNAYWQKNKDLIPAICYALDKEAMVDAILLGHGEAAYSPLQRNRYCYDGAQHYDYNPQKARQILEEAGCTMGSSGFYERDGEEVGFVLSVGAGDQVRADLAQAAAQQLREAGIQCTVDIPVQVDWEGQMAYLIGWGSPFDADDHTYKVFGTKKAANYSGYSNKDVDKWLVKARQSPDEKVRAKAYAQFQEALAKDPAFAFLCYVDAAYVAKSRVRGIAEDTVMGHHGVGIFWNVTEWTIQ